MIKLIIIFICIIGNFSVEIIIIMLIVHHIIYTFISDYLQLENINILYDYYTSTYVELIWTRFI